ncbi:hypothetical protein BGZ63DRAFT_409495 [Mariannaea sp. PMI_226]|nr:hypothetical protein BGZ63DRAFT_409495 [Mariannaea sp. PMI_226]
MAEREESPFQPNALFTCTGNVISILNHDLMVNPPEHADDYVLVVVPNSFSWLHRNQASTLPPSTPTTSPTSHQAGARPTLDFAKMKYINPIKQRQPTDHLNQDEPIQPITPDSPPAKRMLQDLNTTPSKKPRSIPPASSSYSTDSTADEVALVTPAPNTDTVDEIQAPGPNNDPFTSINTRASLSTARHDSTTTVADKPNRRSLIKRQYQA